MNPLLPFLGMFAVYLGTARVCKTVPSVDSPSSHVNDNRRTAMQLCAS